MVAQASLSWSILPKVKPNACHILSEIAVELNGLGLKVNPDVHSIGTSAHNPLALSLSALSLSWRQWRVFIENHSTRFACGLACLAAIH